MLILIGIALIVHTLYLKGAVEETVRGSNQQAVDCYLGNCESSELEYTPKQVSNLMGSVRAESFEEEEELSSLPVTEGMLGIFYADDIGLVEPIYSGASFVNLARGIATVEEYNSFSDQNVSIAGHRVEGPDIRFNRIGELEIGSTVQVGVLNSEGKEELTEYEISEKYEVSQYAVEEMEQSPGESQELTLITCEGYDQLTNTWEERLILKAKVVE